MVFDSYRHFRDTPTYNKVIGDNYLIVEFKCPIEAENFASWSECHYISYVLSGKKKWISANREYMLTAGQSLFVEKGAYMNQQFFEEDFCVLMFFMQDDFIRSFVETDLEIHPGPGETGMMDQRIFRVEVTEPLEVLYKSFFAYLRQKEETPRRIIELKFREMLLNIVQRPGNNGVYNMLLSIAAGQASDLGKIMEDNFCFNLSLEEYARLGGRSLSTFKRDFKKTFNMPPGKWLTARRLEYARKQLSVTNKNVQEVCFDSGFENCSHFIRVFKQAYGLTPLLYSQKHEPIAG